jgi:hypothetical protein
VNKILVLTLDNLILFIVLLRASFVIFLIFYNLQL